MKWFGVDDEGRMRMVGLPVSNAWRGDSDALLEGFEPENPHMLVPRKYGLGWSLNLGAVAVKAGWIRPDDSLPDLADHIPSWLQKALAIVPLVGGALVLGMSAALGQKGKVATKWSLLGRPVKFDSGARATVAPLAISGTVAILPQLVTRSVPESTTAINIATQADIIGVQTLSLATLLSSFRSAEHPAKRQILAALSPLLWPVVSEGIQIACVKAALSKITADLHSQRKEK